MAEPPELLASNAKLERISAVSAQTSSDEKSSSSTNPNRQRQEICIDIPNLFFSPPEALALQAFIRNAEIFSLASDSQRLWQQTHFQVAFHTHFSSEPSEETPPTIVLKLELEPSRFLYTQCGHRQTRKGEKNTGLCTLIVLIVRS